jgi:hypothetical protein
MSKKDPAALFFIDTWLSATAEMDSDVRGWYLNLILHQYDKKDLPNDAEKLAVLAGVKFSEFERFKHVLEHVLMQKFKLNESGRLENGYAKSIIEGREKFKDIRSKSGNIGVVIKTALAIKGFKDKYIERLKQELFNMNEEEINKHKDKHMLEQMLKLYINENENKDLDKDKSIEDSEEIKELHPLQKYVVENLPRVSKLKKQLSFENCEELIKKYPKQKIYDTFVAMENYNKLNYVSVYLTVLNWLKKEEERNPTPSPKKELEPIPASYIFNNVKIDYGNYPHNED